MKTAQIVRWWDFARVFQSLPPAHREKVFQNRGYRHHFGRIAKMHPTLGRALDAYPAPKRVYLFVAYAPNRQELPFMVAQQRRFEAVMSFFKAEKHWPSPTEVRRLMDATQTRPIGARWRDRNRDREPTPEPCTEPTHVDPSAVLAQSLAMAVAHQAPELSELLRTFAARSRQPPHSA